MRHLGQLRHLWRSKSPEIVGNSLYSSSDVGLKSSHGILEVMEGDHLVVGDVVLRVEVEGMDRHRGGEYEDERG